jgi:iron(III) transport system permease protein
MGRLLLEGIAPGGVFDLGVAEKILANRTTWVATWHSIEVAVGGTVVAVLLGGSTALVVALTDLRAKSALVFCFVLPMMIAPQVMALSWLQVFGPSSALLNAVGLAPPIGSPNPLHSREGIILLLGVHYAPLVFLALRAGLRNLHRELVEAAQAVGALRLRVVATVILPLMTPALVAGTALTFVSCVGNFGIPALLGIPGRYTVLTTLIYQRLAGIGTSVLAEVAVLSILISAIAIAGVLLQGWVLRRRRYHGIGAPTPPLPYRLGPWRPAIEAVFWTLIVAILVIPLIALLFTSLVPAYGVKVTAETATLGNYAFVMFDDGATQRAFRNSMFLAFGAAVLLVAICVPLAYFLVWRNHIALRVINFAAELPYALPGLVLAIACILIFLKPIPVIGIGIYNTVWIIFVAYLARFLALELRPVVSGYHQLDRALEEAGQMTGARLVMRLRTIILPLIAPAAAAGALIVFLTAFNELTVSALLWSSGAETLGVRVFNLEQGGFSTEASAVAALTVAVTVALMTLGALIARWLPRGVIPWHD